MGGREEGKERGREGQSLEENGKGKGGKRNRNGRRVDCLHAGKGQVYTYECSVVADPRPR